MSNVYQSAHREFLQWRSTANVYTALLILSMIICLVIVLFEASFQIYLKTLFGFGPLIVVGGVAAIWLCVYKAKIRLELLKDILEQQGYVIARKITDDKVEVLKGPLNRISNYQYFDSNMVEALKSGKIKTAEFSPETYLIAPFGHVTKCYVLLFS